MVADVLRLEAVSRTSGCPLPTTTAASHLPTSALPPASTESMCGPPPGRRCQPRSMTTARRKCRCRL
uniref:Uncharacterized protein n=1 Tax=Triticum urartu TaxID=4572 RepID=A0A8R7QZ82_TRIUA